MHVTTIYNIKMGKVNRDQLDHITKQLEEMSKNSDARKTSSHEVPLSNDEIYNKIMSSSFKRISESKESAVEFLKSAGIFDKDGHLAPEYK